MADWKREETIIDTQEVGVYLVSRPDRKFARFGVFDCDDLVFTLPTNPLFRELDSHAWHAIMDAVIGNGDASFTNGVKVGRREVIEANHEYTGVNKVVAAIEKFTGVDRADW